MLGISVSKSCRAFYADRARGSSVLTSLWVAAASAGAEGAPASQRIRRQACPAFVNKPFPQPFVIQLKRCVLTWGNMPG